MKLYCVNLKEYVPFEGGETLQSVVCLLYTSDAADEY